MWKCYAFSAEIQTKYITPIQERAKWDGRSHPGNDAIQIAQEWAYRARSLDSYWWAGVFNARAYSATGDMFYYDFAMNYARKGLELVETTGVKDNRPIRLERWLGTLRASKGKDQQFY